MNATESEKWAQNRDSDKWKHTKLAYGAVFDQGMLATYLKVRYHANRFFTILYQGADTGPAAIGLRYHLEDVGRIFDAYDCIYVWGTCHFEMLKHHILSSNLLVLNGCGDALCSEKLRFKACSI